MSKKMTGGEAVVQSLIANEVKIVSGLIGSSTLEILDALYDAKGINYIGCRHESNGLIMILRSCLKYKIIAIALPS